MLLNCPHYARTNFEIIKMQTSVENFTLVKVKHKKSDTSLNLLIEVFFIIKVKDLLVYLD